MTQTPATRSEGPMVLPRAFALLRLLADAPNGLTLSALSAALEVPKSSLSSTLKALTEQGFLSREGTLYSLGGEAYRLASTILTGRSLRQIARPYLQQAMLDCDETVLLAQPDADGVSVTYVDQVETAQPIRFSVPLASRRGLYCSAAGQVVLAHLSEAARDSYYAATALEPLTPRTPADRLAVEEIVAQVKHSGLAQTDGVNTSDAAGFAAPVYDADCALTAVVCIAAPRARAVEKVETLREVVRETAADLSATLGYRPRLFA